MIFLTVGHQTPFDRLVRAMDEWADLHGRDDVLAQIGTGDYVPSCFESVPFMSPADYRRALERADAIVAHAGTGTIITAATLRKPLLVLPRRAALGETRNDHQLATARYFGEARRVLVAWDESELPARIEDLATFRPPARQGDRADAELIGRLRDFVFEAA